MQKLRIPKPIGPDEEYKIPKADLEWARTKLLTTSVDDFAERLTDMGGGGAFAQENVLGVAPQRDKKEGNSGENENAKDLKVAKTTLSGRIRDPKSRSGHIED